MNIEVHRTHCCVIHGCKYGWQVGLEGWVCPVASGEIVQEYPCEQCDWAKQEYEEAKRIVDAGDSNWFTPK